MLLGEEKMAAWRDAQVFVLSSYSENFGLAVVEAMAAGLPVIISDKVNLWREVAGAGAGRVVPCAVEPLAAALAELLGDPGLAREMGRRGRDQVREHFRWDRVALALEEAYGRIIAEHRQKAILPM
jgi:glycosyltransferase involved in cell wall biosynthesis